MQLTETNPTTNAVGELARRATTTSGAMPAKVRRVEFSSSYFAVRRHLMHIGRMGRFSSLVVLLLAACGDNLVDGGTSPVPIDDVDPSGNASELPRYVPSVCGVQTWSTNVTGGDAGMNVSVAPRADGAVVLATPRAGGLLTGFVLDTRMNMVSVNKVAIDGAFTQVVASYVHNRLVSTATQDGAVFMHLLDDDLSNPQLTAKLPGNYVADPAFFETQTDLVMPIAGNDGLSLHRFNASFEAVESKLVVPSSPARSMTAAQMGAALLTSWSTDTECYIMMTSTFGGGLDTRLPVTCANQRIAVGDTGQAVMVFDSVDGVRMMTIQPSQFGGNSRVLRDASAAPRTLFDGTNFWISYVDIRGDVIVGFLDANHQLVSMSLAGPKPEAGAYEMAIVDGSPWVFALGNEGYAAYRMCVEAQW
jgi:hypothetical protein